ncbi:unnamed protein product [Hermetia illucens]|uniref:Uncharacterized protein n=1 Tax=Hermetia illucens TaxID=343691 RepID=A0A7R8UYP4_HERIL|nr:unnamed protein product [Hermetia illucens]
MKLLIPKELAEYVNEIDKVSHIVLPELDDPDRIFDAYAMVAGLMDGLVSIDYKIPLVYRKKFKHVAIIATPDKDNKLWDLGVMDPFRVLLVCTTQ